MILQILSANFLELMLWGLVATASMTTILHGSQGLGLSRLSLSFLVGTFFTGRRDAANVIGFLVYLLGGWLFAIGYFAFFASIGRGNWWIGLLLGVVHAIVLLVAVLPLIPYLHPRMASEYEGPSRGQRLEPPGFVGLNYGYRTPLSVVIAQAAYGVVLGICFDISVSAL